MDSWREELTLLKARLAVQQLGLRALVHAHPNPAAVLDAWRTLRADTVMAAYAPAADGEWLSEPAQALAADWTAELALAAARHAERSAADP